MELASMLAGEPFSDRPLSVSPVIASFMRSYNDHAGDERRNGLYAYAARAVGTRGDRGTEEQRARLCMRWARGHFDPPPLRVRVLYRLLRWQAQDLDGVYAARAAIASGRRAPSGDLIGSPSFKSRLNAMRAASRVEHIVSSAAKDERVSRPTMRS